VVGRLFGPLVTSHYSTYSGIRVFLGPCGPDRHSGWFSWLCGTSSSFPAGGGFPCTFRSRRLFTAGNGPRTCSGVKEKSESGCFFSLPKGFFVWSHASAAHGGQVSGGSSAKKRYDDGARWDSVTAGRAPVFPRRRVLFNGKIPLLEGQVDYSEDRRRLSPNRASSATCGNLFGGPATP